MFEWKADKIIGIIIYLFLAGVIFYIIGSFLRLLLKTLMWIVGYKPKEKRRNEEFKLRKCDYEGKLDVSKEYNRPKEKRRHGIFIKPGRPLKPDGIRSRYMNRKYNRTLDEMLPKRKQSKDCYTYPHNSSEEPCHNQEFERVEFATFAPYRITPNCRFVLDVWAYLPHQYNCITAIAQKHGRVNLGLKTGVPVPRGVILTIMINIEGFDVQDPIDTMVFESVPTNASFIIKVPADCTTGEYPGKAVVNYQGVTIAKIVFLIYIDTNEARNYVDHSLKTLYPKSAFASYASENRGEVLSRIQGMKKVAPELDIFIDIFSLRSGQNWQEKLEQHVPTKDTFYLFWSQPAARSKWVEREWRLALSRRGLKYIDPVPLDEPDLVPPPKELSALHFSDAYLSYTKYKCIKKNLQN